MKTTKKLPVPINAKTGLPRSGKDFLVPHPAADESSGYVGIQSGRRYQSGVLVYLGVSVTAQDIRTRAAQSAAIDISAITDQQLDGYLAALDDFKIGNVLTISQAADGSFALSKLAEMYQRHSKPKLP